MNWPSVDDAELDLKWHIPTKGCGSKPCRNFRDNDILKPCGAGGCRRLHNGVGIALDRIDWARDKVQGPSILRLCLLVVGNKATATTLMHTTSLWSVLVKFQLQLLLKITLNVQLALCLDRFSVRCHQRRRMTCLLGLARALSVANPVATRALHNAGRYDKHLKSSSTLMVPTLSAAFRYIYKTDSLFVAFGMPSERSEQVQSPLLLAPKAKTSDFSQRCRHYLWSRGSRTPVQTRPHRSFYMFIS